MLTIMEQKSARSMDGDTVFIDTYEMLDIPKTGIEFCALTVICLLAFMAIVHISQNHFTHYQNRGVNIKNINVSLD
jgi:hypothetical protein